MKATRRTPRALLDLTGETFGEWTVLGRAAPSPSNRQRQRWRCRCTCGTRATVRSDGLRSGRSTSCGCRKFTAPSFSDITGRQFGEWTVLRRVENNKHGNARWLCRCGGCGREFPVIGATLRAGTSSKCLRCAALSPDAPTYGGAHDRVRSQRGRAAGRDCVDCGGVASEWSYDHRDPDELIGLVAGFSGEPFAVPYSTKPEHYDPRCRPCHVRFDKLDHFTPTDQEDQ